MRPSRRSLLGLVGSAGVAGTAGCLGLFGPSIPDCSGDQITALDPPTRGDRSAPVTVEVYSDFACPHCETFATQVAPRIDEEVARGDVLYVHRDYPVPASDRSFPAANAARAVQDTADGAAFWEYGDWLFANQDDLGSDRLVAIAREIGVPEAPVETAVEDGPYCELLKSERSEGADRGVEGTPTVFVDGDRYEAPDGDEFERAVDDALA